MNRRGDSHHHIFLSKRIRWAKTSEDEAELERELVRASQRVNFGATAWVPTGLGGGKE